MPVIPESGYKPPFLFRFRHINTIYAALFRTFPGFRYERERINTPDGDFIDLDWSKKGSDRLLLVLHGLEGSAQRPYVKGIIKYFNQKGWDGVGMNHRSCSGELNQLLRSYHMGVSDDLEAVVQHIRNNFAYKHLVIAGFSLGGNVLLKYLGESGNNTPEILKAAVAISVPCHIISANTEIERWFNHIYVRRFMSTLNKKMEEKAKRFPGEINVSKPMPRNFTEFDNRFTCKLHGFDNALDYWNRTSSHQFLEHIRIPTLLINALDDSFLSERCFPYGIAKENPYFYLETPAWGGHCGFAGDRRSEHHYWTEARAFEFINGFMPS